MRRTPGFLWLALLGLYFGSFRVARGDEVPAAVRVMSYNIRYGTAQDGVNHWDRRKTFLVETIQAFAPDLLGTQETLAFQRDYLAQKLAGYDYLGVGRNNGRNDGEMMALYYKRARFEKLDGGHFWLSETPGTVGSKSWDSSLPRMVTWVKLRDRQQEDVPPVVFFNTHFDHRGTTARLESARLLRREIERLAKDCSTIVTGDFNTGEGSPPYRALFEVDDTKPSPVIDAYRAVHPDRAANEGTFSDFRASATGGERIDWIGVSRDWRIESATIDHTAREGRTPSDHFAVTAEIKVHPNGRFLYVSNRGHDSLAVVAIDESGEKLTFVAAEPTEKTPRSFDIDPSGRFLLSAGESSGRLAVSRIDSETGRLTPIHTEEIGPMLWWVQLKVK